MLRGMKITSINISDNRGPRRKEKQWNGKNITDGIFHIIKE